MKSFEIMDALTDMDDEILLRAEVDTPKRRSGTRKTVTIRWLGRIAAVAAVIMVLTLTALAAEHVGEGNWLGESDWISAVFEKPLTEKPKQVVETLANDFSDRNPTEPATSNGVTITPISAICDNRVCYLHIRLEAPEGTVLADLPEDQTYSFSGEYPGEGIQRVYFNYTEPVVNVQVTALPDEDPTDNIKEFMLEMHTDWYLGVNGQRVTLKFGGLWIKDVNKEVYKNVLRCNLKLSFTVSYNSDRIDIQDTGLSIYNEQYDFTVNLERVYITNLRMVILYTATAPNDFQEIIPDGAVCRIVMKDGTSILVGDQSNTSDGEMVGYFRVSKAEAYTGLNMTNLAREHYLDNKVEMHFEEPIVLEDIDYIIWCGDQIIDVN